jgi:hypothetical protein
MATESLAKTVPKLDPSSINKTPQPMNNVPVKDDLAEISKYRKFVGSNNSEAKTSPMLFAKPNDSNRIIVTSTFAPKSEKTKSPIRDHTIKPVQSVELVKKAAYVKDDDDDDDDSNDDDGIGWSPFVIPGAMVV